VIAATGAVRVANDCEADDGFIGDVRLTHRLLPLFQSVEYLRTFLFAPLGWATLNAMLAAPAGISLLRKDVVLEAGGYCSAAISAEMELLMRMHRLLRGKQQRYHIRFVADPVCWHRVPAAMPALKAQRMHWQQGLSDSLCRNRALLFSRHGSMPGWVAFPFYPLFEWLGPLLETLGYAFIVIAFASGIIPWQTCAAFFSLAIGLGILLSVSGLLLEEMSFRLYSEPADIGRLIAVAVAGNFGYRQLIAYWRARGLVDWLLRKGRRGASRG
jgi:cellulose synthase/poly-beta-1,6-N-acetylglucosamine synthase-like glycosyltransferase